jgi:WD40 repeat protein
MRQPDPDSRPSDNVPAAVQAAVPGLRVGAYQLVRELGRGGQATVWLAEDQRLRRTVALKLLHPSVGMTAGDRLARFRREAEVLAQMDHPGICRIYEADVAGIVPFLAMQFVAGETLDHRLAARRAAQQVPTAVEVSGILAFAEQAARALHAAHEVGVVHRDVKPGNLMLTPDGHPVLLDFGLARHEEVDDAGLTRSGQVVGTVHYMSPEQIAPSRAAIDRRTDVYSLAVTLYEHATLRRPFDASTTHALCHAITNQTATDPRRVNPALPRDLTIVLETAMAKEPHARYPTALEFADDLRRVRLFEPIRARSLGPMTRTLRWCRRHRAVTGLVVALFTVLLAALVIVNDMRRQAEGRRAETERLRVESEERRAAAEKGRLDAEHLRTGYVIMSAVRRNPSLGFLQALHAARARQDRVTNECLHLALQKCTEIGRPRQHKKAICGVLTEPAQGEAVHGGGRVVTFAEDGIARLYRTPDDPAPREIVHDAAGGAIWAATFHPGGEQLATAGNDGCVRVWDMETLRETMTFRHAAAVRHVEFSAAGDLLLTAATAEHSGNAHLWDAKTGAALGPILREPWFSVGLACFSPDPSSTLMLIASGGEALRAQATDFTARAQLVDRSTGQGLAAPWEFAHVITSAAFGPDGRDVLITSRDGNAWMFDAATARVKWRAALGDYVRHGVFLDAERVVLAVSTSERDPASVVLVERQSGKQLASRDAHRGRGSWLVAPSPDGKYLASAGISGMVTILDAKTLVALPGVRRTYDGACLGVAWDTPTTVLAWGSTSLSGTVHRFTIGDPPGITVLRHDARVVSAQWSPDGTRIAVVLVDGSTHVWHTQHRTSRQLETKDIRCAAFAPNGDALATRAKDGAIQWWTAAGERLGEALQCLPCDGPGSHLTFLPPHTARGARLVSVSDQAVVVWDRDTRQPVLRITCPQVTHYAVNHDGSLVATAHPDRCARVWDLHDGQLRTCARLARNEVHPHLCRVFCVAFSPDGRWLAVGGETETCVFECAQWSKIAHWSTGTTGHLAFSPDATLLLGLAKWNRGRQLVVTATWERWSQPHTRTDRATSVCFSRDGKHCLFTHQDGVAEIWNCKAQSLWTTLDAEAGPVICGEFSPDGASVFTAHADDHALRIWPVDPLPAAERVRPPDREEGVPVPVVEGWAEMRPAGARR